MGAGAVVLVIGGMMALRSLTEVGAVEVSRGMEKDFELSDANENDVRVQFLGGLGWQVSEEPLETEEVVIPLEFDEVYQRYNQLQTEQGFDLTPYAGQRAKRYTYAVYNYPGERDTVRANLIISDDELIAGDISSVRIDGFMQGLRMPPAGHGSSQEQSSKAS